MGFEASNFTQVPWYIAILQRC